MKRLKLILYYLIISKLPHSRMIKVSNKIRCWYMTRILKVFEPGEQNFFEPNIYIGDSNDLRIGSNCQINENVFIQGAHIGSYVMIAPNVSILSKSHNFNDIQIPMLEQGESQKQIPIIEDDVWIGRNVIIMPGIRIKKGAIVAAGAIVTKNVESYSVVGGVPAKVIKYRK